MSTVFTADPTSGLAPSSVPGPTTVPILTMPADGDAATAASIAQAIEATANEVAWLKSPRSAAASGSPSLWAVPLRQYKNARGSIRSYIDHRGYPQGQFISREQNWDTLINGTAWPTSGDPWVAVPGTGAVTVRGPSNSTPAHPLSPQLKIVPPTSGIVGPATASYISRIGSCVPSEDLDLSLKFGMTMDAVGGNRTTIVAGMIDASSAGLASPLWGAWFSKANGDVFYQCNVSGIAPVSTGFAPIANTFIEFRIDILGANASDDSAGRVLFYIGNVLFANIAATISGLPTSGDPMVPAFSATTTTTGGAAVAVYLGPVRYRQNTLLNSL